MVWKTEVLAAERGGAKIDVVALPDEDSWQTISGGKECVHCRP